MTTRSKDELFQILSNSRRRYIIYYLSQEGPQLSLKQLARKIAAVESDTLESEITPEERQRVYISLYQTHLPKLESTGIVSYDEDERTVTLTEEMRDSGFFWMDTSSGSQQSWLRYYVALAAASWLLILGVSVSIPPFSVLGWAGVALLVSLALVVLTAAHYYTERSRASDRSAGYEMLVK